MHSDPEKDLGDDEREPLYHRDESGHFTLTEKGIEQYRKRFARFGLRVEAIHTLEDFQNALELSAAGLNDHRVAIASHGPRSLERNLVVAFARGDEVEYLRLLHLVERRNTLGLRVVDPSSVVTP
ncbi:MAG: hypothetical protein KDJ34_01265 [Candidatus Competibacteraceae bacterium]|nr:hypothetical protein [Candidatus Competibacteraceae bacterium]